MMKTTLALTALLLAVALPAQAHVVAAGGHARQVQKVPAPSACALHTWCKTARVWVPKEIQLIEKQVWVAPKPYKVWVPAVYETHCGYGGKSYKVLVKPGHHATHWTPGHYETVTEKVLVPGHWEMGCKPIPTPKLPKVVLPHHHGSSCGCPPGHIGKGPYAKKKGPAYGC